ncbi:MAG: T9SS C-terminal target domain-containing protein [Flavobacterium sp.]|nr:MAG: T9SS C-terminal target domain-containing protein [Flavobacterium sp.]
MQKTRLVLLFSIFNLFFLRANPIAEIKVAESSFNVTVSYTGDVEVTFNDYDFTSTYEWQFEYGPIGFKSGQGTVINVSGIHFYRFTVNPLYGYDFRVRQRYLSNNNLVWTDWSSAKTIFPTSDKVFSVGYTTNFDTQSETELEWRGLLYTNSSSTAGIYQSQDNHSENNTPGFSMRMTNYNYENGSEIALVSPKFNDLATDRKIKFWTFGYGSDIELLVGTMANPNDLSTFHLLSRVENTQDYGWHQKTVYFNNYKGSDQYIVFLFKRKYYGAHEHISIDDFSYETATNCYDLTNFSLTNVGQTSAQISFDSQNQSDYEVSVTNVVRRTTEIVKIQGSSYTLTNLIGNTDYEIKVRAHCIDDLYSNWTKAISFKTPCTVISGNYSTSFEGTEYVDPCWSTIENSCLVRSSMENLGTTPKLIAKTGEASIRMSDFVGALNVNKAYLITPYIGDLDTDKRIKFSLITYSGEDTYNRTSLTIGTMSDPKDASTFVALKSILPSEMNELQNDNKSSEWKEHTVYLDNYTKSSNHHYIAIRYNNEGKSQFNIDDFIYESTPSCTEPLNPVTVDFGYDFAIVKWDNYKPASEWQIEYGSKGFEHGKGTIVTITSYPFKITESILGDTEYDFYVRSKCGSNYSPWSDRGYFRTNCEGFTAGYTEGFENSSFEKSGCWTRIVPYFNQRWYNKNRYISDINGNAGTLVHSGTKSICVTNQTDDPFPAGTGENADRVVLVSPRLKDLDHYKKVIFWLKARAGLSKKPIEVSIGTLSDPRDYNTFTVYKVLTVPEENIDKWIKYEVELSDYYGIDKYVGFKHSSNNQRLDYFYIDDFEYVQNECPRSGLLGARQSGSDIASLDWRDNNTKKASQSWDIEYGPKGFTDGQGTIVNVNTNPYNLKGLVQGIYDYRVRAYCEKEIVSEWSDRYTFKIGCTEKSPFVENFDQYVATNEPPGFCWSKNSFLDTQVYEYSLPNINSAPNTFYLQNNADTALLVSPYLEDFDQNKKIKFWVNQQINTVDLKFGTLIIGTIKNPIDISTFEPYQSISLEELRNLPKYGKEINVDFSEYKGTNKQIAFRFVAENLEFQGTNRVLIDDIHYDQTLSCYEPIDVVFSKINNESLQINWTSKNKTSQKVEIEYGPTGFVPGTGKISVANGNEIKISNLEEGTSYQFYLKTVCDSGNSIVVGPKKIETTCKGKSLPWIENFSNLENYGANVLPNCFKLLYGNLRLENTNISDQQYNFGPDYMRSGYDDTSYLHIKGSHRTELMTPMFFLAAGTTYKFSLKARNSYEYRTQGVGLSVGRGQNDYNMETNVSRSGLGRLTEYNYSDVSYYFTPMISGDYSFLMDFSNSSSPNLLADKFELTEGYKMTVDGSKELTFYDFQNEISDDIIIEETRDSYINVEFESQSINNKVVVMNGNSSPDQWVTVANASVSGKTTESSISVWEVNQRSITKINTKVAAKNATSLFMSFDLKQTFVTSNTESMFRVVVNGNVIGTIRPVQNIGDNFEKYVFDLTPYVGSEIRISLQHIGKSYLGDTAYLDNLSFAKTVKSLSIDENKTTDFKYYPNPIENVLNIESNSIISNLEIYDVNGQLLFENKYSDSKISVDFKRFSAGLYLIVLKSEEKKKIFKVIKK